MIPFGEWLPDQSNLSNPGCTVAENVLPAARGYKPFKSLAPLSNAADSRLRGFYASKRSDGTVDLFAGDAGKLYKFNDTNSNLDDVSDTGGYSVASDGQWRFVQFGDDVIASSGLSDTLQKYTIGTSSTFSAISGAPAAKFLAVVRDFVVTANVNYSSTDHPYRVRWSQINDADAWTVGSAQADVQDIPDAGNITGLVGGEFGVVLMERAIARMQYVGSPLIFTFEKVETGHGCNYPNGYAALGPTQVFYLADDGFFMFDGNRSIPIGAEKVDTFFFDDVSFNLIDRISCSLDPENQIVIWSYCSNDSTADPDRLLIYNYAVGKWSLIKVEHEFIGSVLAPGYTIETLDLISTSIDDLDTSLDSRLLEGGFFQFACSKDSKIQTFTGPAFDATLETTEFEGAPMRQSMITAVTPFVTLNETPPSITAQVGSRSRQIDAPAFTAASSINDDNLCPVRSSGRYHRVRVNLSGTWRYALGVDVDAVAQGKR